MEEFSEIWASSTRSGNDFILNLSNQDSYLLIYKERGELFSEWGEYNVDSVTDTKTGRFQANITFYPQDNHGGLIDLIHGDGVWEYDTFDYEIPEIRVSSLLKLVRCTRMEWS